MTSHQAHFAPASPLVEFWNDILVPKCLAYQHILVGGLSRHSDHVFPDLPVHQGQNILDVGCGFGDTAIALARKTGPAGHVLGVDCCPAFLERARQYADQSQASNVGFACADAERFLPRGSFDQVFSRFGTMFFANPVAGLRNMRQALKPGGRLTHIVWRQRTDNPWLAAARDVLLEMLPQPDDNAPSCGPGPFSMADPDLTRNQMAAAGFHDITFKRIDAMVLVGRDIEEAINFQLALGPAGEIYRNAGIQADQKRPEIVRNLRALFEKETRDRRGIWMKSSSWMITAQGQPSPLL